ncbi:ornithine cyclodeaminase [Streptomyces sulfonofaciens]|uniref:Ornithine cyclodeaminase n=1 Tax=Streptomyces sulfonofaciens TaxID=68272 RepID=A0A919GM20_9ACTN|nr:ornithine cyclodeaminase family protein [Streptomyces sulfonofaciens]GHH86901.1 ornithine cyclodeaminase [Streptomyces sulfonofaciens]
MPALPHIDAETLMSLVSWHEAMAALERAACGAGTAAPRTSLPAPGGHLLVMPAVSVGSAGVKLAGVAPGNPALGPPRIQAVFVLFDAATLAPRALVDGTALTLLRTPALSALAVRALAAPDSSVLTVFGTGPQAWEHIRAVSAVRDIRRVHVVGRTARRVAGFLGRLRSEGVEAAAASPEDVAEADVVVCATSATRPVFDGSLLKDGACVVAVGSHEPGARELDDTVFTRASRVFVEDIATALREAGDVVQALSSGAVTDKGLTALADLPRTPPAGGISVFKSVGMGWQDLAVAEAAYAAWSTGPRL